VDYQTIPAMFVGITNNYAEKELFREKVDGEWIGITGREARETVENATYGLAAMGLQRGDHIAILSTNCPRWAFSDYAIACFGGSSVSVYPTLIASQVQYVVNHSESKLIFAQDQEQVDKVREIKSQCPHLRTIVCLDDTLTFDEDYIISFNDLLEKGKGYRTGADAFNFETRVSEVTPNDVLALIYTSGTTGNPKGVMLTNGNMCSNIDGGLDRITVGNDSVFLSFLPLSHSFEKIVDYICTTDGGTVAYAEAMDKVIDNLKEVEPTHACSVPRLFEKMYAGVQAKFAGGSFIKRMIANWAVKTGYAYADARRSGNVPDKLAKKYARANKLVFSKVQALLGPNFKFFVSGGAPLPAEIGRFFEAAGIKILEGYGLTETSPVIGLNPEDDYRHGTVGPPIYNVEVKIADDGEILSRGPHIMKGYFRDEAATRECINEEGWFHTGDIGVLEDGYLRITDRKKNLIVTAGGKNIAPAPIEAALVLDKYIEQSLVLGDRKKFISAIVVPNFAELTTWAEENGVAETDPESLIENDKVRELFDDVVENAMSSFSRFEAVKKYFLMPKEFTIEDGTLTPTLKIKKRIVEERYKDKIDALYEEQ